jgi:hypothetical protein
MLGANALTNFDNFMDKSKNDETSDYRSKHALNKRLWEKICVFYRGKSN